MSKRNKNKKKEHKTARKVGKVIKYVLLTLLAVFLILFCIGLGAVLGAKHSAPELTSSSVLQTAVPSVILDDQGNEIIQLSAQGARKTEATSEEVPDILKWAYVDLEDERFYEHNGIDTKGIIRALYVSLSTDRTEGASTITQQLIKNNIFETGGFERSTGSALKRKVQEWFLAIELEKQLSKDEILLDYMNSIFLGSGNYGVKEAASYYFGKDLQDLTVAECAVIASITQNPSAYNPARYPEKNWERAEKCLKKMLENGHITQEQYDEAVNEDVYSHIVAAANITAGSSIYSYYVDALIEQVIEDLQEDLGYTYAQAYNALYCGGLTIYSYQNAEAQEIIDKEINNEDNYVGIETSYSISWDATVKNADGSVSYYTQSNLLKYFREHEDANYVLDYESKADADRAVEEYKTFLTEGGGEVTSEHIYYTLQPQASFTLMDYTTGRVLAICGGRGEKETSLSLNRATDSNRQPGSLFKITATFAPALDTGKCTLATVFDDEPYSYSDSGKIISNWWGDSYRGLSTIRDAIRDSMNVVTCKTMMYVGASRSLTYLEKFGYESIVDEDATMALAIGGVKYGTTNLENTAAFSAIANDGVYMEPLYYSKIVDRNGSVLLGINTGYP